MRCRVRGQGIRRFASADSGAADVVGNILTLGITVSLATGFSVFLLAMPGPDPEEPARVEAFILANRPDRVVLEHRGGSAIPVRAMGLLVDVDGASALYDVGARLAAADPAFAVVSAQGLAKTATDRFETGDQLQYTNASIRGREVTIGMKEGDIARLFFNSRVLETDTTAPVLVSARTLAATRIQLNFSERLFEVSPTDFSVSNGSISTISLLGNGSAAEIVTSPYGPNATPTVSTAGSPAGTRDLANVLLAGGTSVVAADGVAPTITVAPGATAGT
ncbi:MAG: type IV pilin N-terminal domain-containing protein, partial [Methanobacteriota archaeon]